MHTRFLLAARALALAAFALQTLTATAAPIPISCPGTISSPGVYKLVSNGPNGIGFLQVGITINADNVTLDLDGQTIDCNGTSSFSTGILVKGNRKNVTIQNGKIVDFGSAIATSLLSTVTNLRVHHVQISDCNVGILGLGFVTKSSITHNSFQTYLDGVGFKGSGNEFCFNKLVTKRYGFTIIGDYNRFVCNTVQGIDDEHDGILLVGSHGTLVNNTCYDLEHGIKILGDSNLLRGNKCYGNEQAGIRIKGAKNNSQANTAVTNLGYDLRDDSLTAVSCPNIWKNNFFKTDNDITGSGPGAGCIQ